MDATIMALIANFNAQLPLMYAHMPGIQVIQAPDWMGMVSQHPDVVYNAVYATRFNIDNVSQRVDDVVAVYSRDGCLPMTWYVVPDSQPATLSKTLESKNFRFAARGPGMFLELDKFKAAANHSNSPHKIYRVSNVDQLTRWMIPIRESFGLSPEVLAAYFELFQSQGFDERLPWKLYVGEVAGEPVSSVRLFVTGQTAGIFNVAVIPSMRGKGYGSEITRAALSAGKRLGCKLSILAATDMGYPVYERLGFKECCAAEIYFSPEMVR